MHFHFIYSCFRL